MLRYGGTTIAAGMVTEVSKTITMVVYSIYKKILIRYKELN